MLNVEQINTLKGIGDRYGRLHGFTYFEVVVTEEMRDRGFFLNDSSTGCNYVEVEVWTNFNMVHVLKIDKNDVILDVNVQVLEF